MPNTGSLSDDDKLKTKVCASPRPVKFTVVHSVDNVPPRGEIEIHRTGRAVAGIEPGDRQFEEIRGTKFLSETIAIEHRKCVIRGIGNVDRLRQIAIGENDRCGWIRTRKRVGHGVVGTAIAAPTPGHIVSIILEVVVRIAVGIISSTHILMFE